MAKSIVIAAFLLAATAGVAAYGQDNNLVAPELSKPAPGHLLDQDYTTSTGETCRGQAFLKRRARRRSIARSSKRTTRSTIAFAKGAEPAGRPPRASADSRLSRYGGGERPRPCMRPRAPEQGSRAALLHGDLRLHRIGDEADFVGLVVQAIELLLRGAAPAHSIFGRSFTLVTASRPGAISSVVPSAWSS